MRKKDGEEQKSTLSTTKNYINTTVNENKQTTDIYRNETTINTTEILGNSTNWNTTSIENTDNPLVIVIAGTITGSVLIITLVVLLLVFFHLTRRSERKAADRVRHSQVYVNHGVVAHSIDDDSKSGIPRNISWKSLEQSNMHSNSIYSLSKGSDVENSKTEKSEEKVEDPVFEKQTSESDHNYFILEKIYMNDDGITDDDYVNDIQCDNVHTRELKRENDYSLRKVTWISKSDKLENDPEMQSGNTESLQKAQHSSEDSGVDDDVYNVLGENSRNNSVVSANYDSMERILKEHHQLETENIYYNDEEYSDNYDVLRLAGRSREPNVMSDTYSTAQQIKQQRCSL